MTNMNSEASNKFISALVKALQTLCHGYVEFNDGVEIIGHIYLNIDSGSSFDYVVKEKLCKNAENSTVFVSKSFQAQAPAEESSSKRDREDVSAEYDNSLSPTVGTSRLQSAIASMSNVLSGSQDQKPRFMGHSSHHHHHHLAQNPVKRKRDHNDQFNNLQPPFKYTTLQTPSSSSSSSVAAIYFNSGQQPKQLGERNHFGSGSHGTDYLPPDSNRSSAMDPEDEDDLNLDVTFVKEEYENQRNAGHKANVARLGQVTDLSTNQTTVLHPGTTGGLVFPTSHQQQHLPQEFTTGTPADTGGSSSSQTFQDSSQMNLTQQAGPSVPNPRNDASAGPPEKMPDGVKPLCGYVHPADVKKWSMFELVSGSGVYIHQDNFQAVLSKSRQDRPDGKAMARYLMSCFWKQGELVGASIAEPPKPYQRSLDRGIINTILEFCVEQSHLSKSQLRQVLWNKITCANTYRKQQLIMRGAWLA